VWNKSQILAQFSLPNGTKEQKELLEKKSKIKTVRKLLWPGTAYFVQN